MQEEHPGEPEAGPAEELPRPPERERRAGRLAEPRRARPRRRLVLLPVGVVLLVAVFLIGLAVGRALEDAPRPGGEQTIVRTLVPSTLGPADVVTVTVTVTGS